ncbi:MAG: outer membrane beta-barrel protein [Treponemataceae bacterium]|nr:outer membrane beta-barrel protein [Treponemataceae bacterium]
MFSPVAGDGDNVLTGWQNSWGGGIRTAKLGWSWTSDDEKVGMLADFCYDNLGVFGAGDWAAGWWQPADWVKLSVGHIDATGGELRSDVCYGSWDWIRPNYWVQGDEGITFNAGGVDGLRVQLFPVEGLQIMAQLGLPLSSDNKFYTKGVDVKDYTDDEKKDDFDKYVITAEDKHSVTTYDKAYRLYGNGSVAVGYTIADIGTIKAAFLGNYDGDKGTYGKVNVAFDLTAIENMFLTVGVRIPVEDKISEGEQVVLPSLGFSYQILDNFKIALTASADIKKSKDPAISAGIGIGYGLTDTLGLTADFRYLGDLEADKSYISFLVGLDYNFASNGKLGIGFQGFTEGKGFVAGFEGKGDEFCWAVPIMFQIAF